MPVYGLSMPKNLQSSQDMSLVDHPPGHLTTSFKVQ